MAFACCAAEVGVLRGFGGNFPELSTQNEFRVWGSGFSATECDLLAPGAR